MSWSIGKLVDSFNGPPVRDKGHLHGAVGCGRVKCAAAQVSIVAEVGVEFLVHNFEAIGELFDVRGEEPHGMVVLAAEVEAHYFLVGSAIGKIAISIRNLCGGTRKNRVLEIGIGKEVEGDEGGVGEAAEQDSESWEEHIVRWDEESEDRLEDTTN